MGNYEPGQVWKYETRPGEKDSRLTVVKIDHHDEFGCIVHIFVSNVSISCEQAPGGVVENIHHAPYTEEALDGCVLELESSNVELPPYEEGYAAWKAAFDEGQAGVFSFAVSDGIDATEAAMGAP